MQQLLSSEREVITFAAEIGLPTYFPRVGPEQVQDTELELLQLTVLRAPMRGPTRLGMVSVGPQRHAAQVEYGRLILPEVCDAWPDLAGSLLALHGCCEGRQS
jgi:hypothetical protein